MASPGKNAQKYENLEGSNQEIARLVDARGSIPRKQIKNSENSVISSCH